MNYILDTNICDYYFNGSESIKNKIREVGANSLALTCGILALLELSAMIRENPRQRK